MEGGRAVESESNSVKENTWQHIVIVYNGDEIIESDRLKLYINGIYSGNFPKGDQFTPTQVGTIANRTVLGGAVGLSGGPIWARFIGEIDEFRIYQRNLSQSEISFLASQ
jgi:hypothetical protein